MAFHHLAATANVVGRIGRIVLEFLLLRSLAARRLACQVGLVHPHCHSFHQRAVGRHLIARLDHHRIAHHDILPLDALDVAVAIHRHHLLVLALVEDVELLVGAQLEDEAHRCGQHHRHKDAQRLKEHAGAFGSRKQLIERHSHRQQQGYQQNTNDWVAKLLQKLLPKRILRRWGQHIVTMFAAALFHLFLRQTAFIISCHNSIFLIFAMKKTAQKYNLVSN